MGKTVKEMPRVPYEGYIIGWVEKNLPPDFVCILGSIAEEGRQELWNIRGRLEKTYRPKKGGMSFESYFFRYAPAKLLGYFWERYLDRQKLLLDLAELVAECENDDKDGITRHKHLKLDQFFDERKQLGTMLEENDAMEILGNLAASYGLERVLRMVVEGYTQKEIAKATNQTKDAVKKQMQRLVLKAREIFQK